MTSLLHGHSIQRPDFLRWFSIAKCISKWIGGGRLLLKARSVPETGYIYVCVCVDAIYKLGLASFLRGENLNSSILKNWMVSIAIHKVR